MKYFYDLEFFEDGSTIAPISIGVHAEDGRTYYAVASDAPYARIRQHPWMRSNVLPHLPHAKPEKWGMLSSKDEWYAKYFDVSMKDASVKPTWVIANELFAFLQGNPCVQGDTTVELWADYGAYDHVCLMQFWGSMVKKPPFLPMFTHDIQQLLSGAKLTDEDWYASDVYQEAVENPAGIMPHHALFDAQHALLKHMWATTLIEGRAADAGMQAWQDGNRAAVQARSMPMQATEPDTRKKPEPISFEDVSLEEAVGQAIGAASMCWTPGPQDLVFDTTRAREIYDALMERLARPEGLLPPNEPARVSIHEAELPGGMLISTVTLPEPKEDPETEEEIAQKEGY